MSIGETFHCNIPCNDIQSRERYVNELRVFFVFCKQRHTSFSRFWVKLKILVWSKRLVTGWKLCTIFLVFFKQNCRDCIGFVTIAVSFIYKVIHLCVQSFPVSAVEINWDYTHYIYLFFCYECIHWHFTASWLFFHRCTRSERTFLVWSILYGTLRAVWRVLMVSLNSGILSHLTLDANLVTQILTNINLSIYLVSLTNIGLLRGAEYVYCVLLFFFLYTNLTFYWLRT